MRDIFGTAIYSLMLTTCLVSSALAEHRVALLIGNSAYAKEEDAVASQDLRALAQALEKYGFQCRVAENFETDNDLRDAIEGFASNTPTRSTALVYYSGRLSDGPGLLGVGSRSSYALERMMDAFDTRGGSRQHLVFIDAPGETGFDGEVPDGCQLTFGDTDALLPKLDGQADLIAALSAAGKGTSKLPKDVTLIGKGSPLISPPDQFVQGNKPGDEWINSMGLVFCWCPPGKYVAGSPEGTLGRYPDEQQREVTIKHGFWLAKYELAHSQPVAGRRGGNRTIASHKLDPMTMINHDDAKAMTRNFTASERKAGRLPADWEYSLPTEEQWEHAARAGTTTRFYFGDDISDLPHHANFADKSYYDSKDIFSNAAHRTFDDGAVQLAHVGSYQPNPWGFHDMYGNVAEWCIDQAVRGGSWASAAENCRSAYRDNFSSRNEQNFIGYRLVIQKASADSK